MAVITAAQVKELRERTGAGMMECKKALESISSDKQLSNDELMNMAIEELISYILKILLSIFQYNCD